MQAVLKPVSQPPRKRCVGKPEQTLELTITAAQEKTALGKQDNQESGIKKLEELLEKVLYYYDDVHIKMEKEIQQPIHSKLSLKTLNFKKELNRQHLIKIYTLKNPHIILTINEETEIVPPHPDGQEEAKQSEAITSTEIEIDGQDQEKTTEISTEITIQLD
ncbi:hypothetical protein CL658_02000 [bacterium]|nr:hypothetical protein [bacterium]